MLPAMCSTPPCMNIAVKIVIQNGWLVSVEHAVHLRLHRLPGRGRERLGPPSQSG